MSIQFFIKKMNTNYLGEARTDAIKFIIPIRSGKIDMIGGKSSEQKEEREEKQEQRRNQRYEK
ncbi:hypothetical protein ACFSMW_00970 [Virgibacillus halophilus]